jgi:hypothetical protein
MPYNASAATNPSPKPVEETQLIERPTSNKSNVHDTSAVAKHRDVVLQTTPPVLSILAIENDVDVSVGDALKTWDITADYPRLSIQEITSKDAL